MDMRRLCKGMDLPVSKDMETLDMRGLVFCVHFGAANASAMLREMDESMDEGRLYEWLRDRLGIVTK